MASSVGFHEAPESLRPETMERHRAWASLQEELEAIDWYDQRIDASGDEVLAGLLRHNRDEEKEHAAMMIEWLRRHDPKWDEMLNLYLFKEEPILEIEAEADAASAGGGASSGSAEPPGGGGLAGDLGIRSLRGASTL